MRKIFEDIRTECAVCGTKLSGKNIRKRGDNYYCASHFQSTSTQEKINNDFQDRRKENYDKFFKS